MATPYREHILDHYLHPRNRGTLDGADVSGQLDNPTCGDVIRFDVRLDGDCVSEARFEGRGCVLSIAAASMLTEAVVGKSVAELSTLSDADVFAMLGLELGPVRAKCATLALRVLQQGLAGWQERNR